MPSATEQTQRNYAEELRKQRLNDRLSNKKKGGLGEEARKIQDAYKKWKKIQIALWVLGGIFLNPISLILMFGFLFIIVLSVLDWTDILKIFVGVVWDYVTSYF